MDFTNCVLTYMFLYNDLGRSDHVIKTVLLISH